MDKEKVREEVDTDEVKRVTKVIDPLVILKFGKRVAEVSLAAFTGIFEIDDCAL